MSSDSDTSDNNEDTPTCSSQACSWQEHSIELVRVRPILYDKHDRGYFDKDAKAHNWKDVTEQLISAGYAEIKNQTVSK